jgi:pyruvate,water dikinase
MLNQFPPTVEPFDQTCSSLKGRTTMLATTTPTFPVNWEDSADAGYFWMFERMPVPPTLGMPPSGEPASDPVSVALKKFFGAPPLATDDRTVIRGNSGSPGKPTGVARVVRSLAGAGKLQPGDVLVVETTAPPWTPLFATAVAVVSDTGGILSHCAVVAREYGIPAVVGTDSATSILVDGQSIEVDGDAGTVRLVKGR